MSNDILDLRTLADEWRSIQDERDGELEDVTDEIERGRIDDEFDNQEKQYIELCDELGIDQTPDDLAYHGDSYEPALIHEDYFEQYAEQLADDLGYLHMEGDVRDRWPFNHINWRAAAEELKADYTTVEYDGDTYYMRSC